ncbi:cupin domain-containing protein [soil metagenome]
MSVIKNVDPGPGADALVVEPGEGRAVSLGGLGVVFKIMGERTAGAFSIVEHSVAPGTLAPAHVHEREDELSYVIEGELGVRIGDEERVVPAGAYVGKPRGVPHAFWNKSEGPARLIELIAPAGFERYFAELAELFADGAPPPERIAALRERYGLRAVDWNEDLERRHGVRMRRARP